MLQIVTTVQGEKKELDLYQNEPVFVNLSFAELQDITKKNSNFSKAFSLPGTKKNNEIFNFFYDINAIPVDFNPNNKFAAVLMWDGYELFQGHIRLNGVTIDNGEIIYQVTFYNQVGDLMSNIGDKYLFDLDLNYLSHPFNDNVILYSNLDPNLFPLTGTTDYSYENGKTMWGLFNIGYNYVQSTSAYTQFYSGSSTSSIQLKAGPHTLVTQPNLFYQPNDNIRVAHNNEKFFIGTVTSYTASTGQMRFNASNAQGTGTYNSWRVTYELPPTGQIVDLNTTPLLQFTAPQQEQALYYNPAPPNFDFSATPVNQYYFKPSIQARELYHAIVSEAGYELSSEFMDTEYFKRFYMPLKFVDESIYSRNAIPACYNYTNGDFDLSNYTPTIYTNPSSGITCNDLGFSSNTTTFVVPSAYTGTYTFRYTFNVVPESPCDYLYGSYPFVAVVFSDGTNTQTIYQNIFCNTGPQQVSFEQTFVFSAQSTFQLWFSGQDCKISGFTQTTVNSPRFIPQGSLVNYDIEFPDNEYKQIDYITSINKMFNLIVVPNAEKPKELIVEPIVDYVGKGRVLDWTTKVDFSQPQQLYPTTSLVNGTLQYEFKLDQDYANQDFKTQTNRIFGTDNFKLNLEYKDEVTRFDFIFSSPVDITINNSYVPLITLSSMSKVKTVDKNGASQQTFVPFKLLPKLVFRGPTIPNDNWGFIGGSGETTGSIFCTSGITLNVTDPGYIKWNDCNGNSLYQYVNNGTYVIPDCGDASTVRVGIPFADLANFTITSSGSTCGTFVNPPVYQYWYTESFPNDRFTNLNRFTTYPFAYTGFSHYTNYRGEDRTNITPSEFTFASEDMYDIYYKDYVEDVTSEENKIYATKIYLYPQDIQELQWNEKILINNTYFRINKITNFNALEPSVCDIELVKLTKEYEGRRILYYDLIPCSTGDTLHSNSDLMYHLYAYAGRYVKLYDDSLNYLGCYSVNIGAYDVNDTYEHYYLSTGYTPTGVGIYGDCGCTGRTDMVIVQEEPGVDRAFYYSGSVCNSATTITFSSTSASLSATTVYKVYNPLTLQEYCVTNIIPTFIQSTNNKVINTYDDCSECACIQCYEYSFTAATSHQISWLNCDGQLDFTNVLAGEVALIQCARQGTFQGNGTLQQGALCFDGCVTPTPTPTVSVTPSITPSNTATPSPTPSPVCYDCDTYEVYAEFDGPVGFFEYYDCRLILRTQRVFSFTSVQVCAIQGTIQWLDIPLYDTITSLGSCGNTCVPSVTPTTTSTPTNTPTNTLTPSPTASIGSTPAPTTTPTNTPTNTMTPSQTGTPEVTPTPTSTLPSFDCFCYWLLNETGTGGDYSYTQCGSITPISDSLGAGQSVRICSSDLPVADPNITITPCSSTTNCTQDSDCTSCT